MDTKWTDIDAADSLRVWRTLNRKTVRELAEMVGVSRTTIWNAENRIKPLGADVAARIEAATGGAVSAAGLRKVA